MQAFFLLLIFGRAPGLYLSLETRVSSANAPRMRDPRRQVPISCSTWPRPSTKCAKAEYARLSAENETVSRFRCALLERKVQYRHHRLAAAAQIESRLTSVERFQARS